MQNRRTLSVNVQDDHLQKISGGQTPVASLCELIWNGLDADAQEVEVTFANNLLGGLDSIEVWDNGTGISNRDLAAFENLGGSWKAASVRTRQEKRMLHGKEGKGRFQAHNLGADVVWHTVSRDHVGSSLYAISIESNVSAIKRPIATTNLETNAEETSTTVKISNLTEKARGLRSSESRLQITRRLAPYLRQYPEVSVVYDGLTIDPKEYEIESKDYILSDIELNDGRKIDVKLTITEWGMDLERAVYLCDDAGFTLEEIHPKIPAPNFSYTAYVKSNFVRELYDKSQLFWQNDGLKSPIDPVVERVKTEVRTHFRKRAADKAQTAVQQWKSEDIYPYSGEAKTPAEEVERQVFDVVSMNVKEFLPSFEKSDLKTQAFQLRLIKQSLEKSPAELLKVVQEVLDLPEAKVVELSNLLNKTSLSAIISASRLVADRLDFLHGLEMLLFSKDSKKTLLERRELHKVLAEQTWIFGEEFHLTVNDQSLTEVLRKHIALLKRDNLNDAGDDEGEIYELDEVLRSDGSRGIVDLMLSRSIPRARSQQRHHLIVELKRPKQKIDMEVLSQAVSYGAAIKNDERFKDVNTFWSVWAVSNEMDDVARGACTQIGKPEGVFSDQGNLIIWAKSWGQIIEECRSRLQFYSERLAYVSDDDSAIEYLKAVHGKYLLNSVVVNKPKSDEQALLATRQEESIGNLPKKKDRKRKKPRD